MKKLLALLLIVFSCQSVFAITPEQNYVNREAQRKEYADAMQRTHAMINRSTASSNGTTVTQTAKASATVSSGSKVTGSASVTKIADKAKVAATLAGRYGKSIAKASVGGFVGAAAFNALMRGVDYVIDEGGKVSKPQVDDSCIDDSCSNLSNYWTHETLNYKGYSTVISTCKALATRHTQEYKSFNIGKDNSGIPWAECIMQGDSWGLIYRTNTSYDSSSVEPTPAELETALKNALESNNPALAAAIAQAIKDAYTHDGATAAIDDSTNELASSSDDDIAQAIDRAARNTGSESDSYGTPGYSKVVTPEKTIEASVNPADTSAQTTTDSTTKNPDGTTSTTSSSGSTQFPAFCDWASIVCDWWDWTSKDDVPTSTENDDKVQDDKEIPTTIKTDTFKFNGQCPAPISLEIPSPFSASNTLTYSLDTFCLWLTKLKPWIDVVGWLIALGIISGQRSSNNE